MQPLECVGVRFDVNKHVEGNGGQVAHGHLIGATGQTAATDKQHGGCNITLTNSAYLLNFHTLFR